MSHVPAPTLDRRSGVDRRLPVATAAPFVWADGVGGVRPRDPWAAVVARGIEEYRSGSLDELARSWDESLAWRVVADWPGHVRDGAIAVFAYHRELQEMTGGSFRQEVLSIDASGGPIVVAHVRTVARRSTGRRLEIPSLLTFELVAMRIHRVTEIPGDRDDWDGFWED